MSEQFQFDPTKVNGGLPQRALGQIVIQWDPNTGKLGFQSQGLTPIEEVGVTTWFTHLRMKMFLEQNESQQVILAPPGTKVINPS